MDLFEFEKLVNNGNLYLDGATGTNLQRQGLKSGACPETWIMEHPDIMQSLQLEYLRSGSNIIYAPTFTANRVKLAEFGIRDSLPKLNHDLVSLSREAVRKYREESESSRPCFVAGDVTMTGLQLYPVGSLDFEELVDIYREQIGELIDAGCDLLAIETMMSLNESRAALIAAREIGDFPVFVTMTFEENGRSLYGTDPLTALLTLQSLGATAFGINCSTGPSAMLPWIEELTAAAEIPIICKPNAGLPKLDPVSGGTFYDLSPEDFALSMRQAVEAGARIVGGCCGTTPRHIQKLVEKTSNLKSVDKYKAESGVHYLTSERKSSYFSLNEGTRIIGERLNPTGKKALQAELRDQKTDLAVEMAETQEEKGAFAIDVNVGVSGIDEKAMMQRVIDDVSAAVSIPLVIDTSRVDVMEAALRRYPGRPLINSISAESERMEPMLRLAKKYGAMFIILPVSDEGFPKTLEDRKRNAKIVIEKALSMGLKKADMVVDGLVGTVAAERNAALDTVEFIRYCKNELGLATIVGLSNISFGLPARQKVNSAFLAMASMSGLTMALLNPEQDLLVDSLYASNLLSGREGAAESY
ncbi:MAG: homocysteine S-methyltransferase family protein, partial [Lachnospiraceae bacterium]|nr:homocysteine S-methyltransferase family protein [Lachnospiraceae bacterium]